jgi:putative chitinase
VLAYILATVYHETDRKMQPLEEYGRGRGQPYGKPDPITGNIYYGRGLIQLTWKKYYAQMGDILSIDLVNHPELAMELPVSAAVLVEAMMRGIFGHKVTDYINSEHVDWINARKTINGLDQANAIAGFAQRFFNALQGASPT